MNRRLQALRVGNFKAFSATQRIPLKPITLVFGPNSAGKSSFIHSLALAHEAQFGREKRGRSRLDVHHTDIGGSAIDLGGFRQFIFRGQLNRRMEWGAELKVAELDPVKDQRLTALLAPVQSVSLSVFLGMELDNAGKSQTGAEPRVDSIEIAADGQELLRMSRRLQGGRGGAAGMLMRIDRLASDHAIFRQIVGAIVESQTTSEKVQPEDYEIAKVAIANLVPELPVRLDQLFSTSVELHKLDPGAFTLAGALVPVGRGNREEAIAQAIRLVLPRTINDLIRGLGDVLSDELAQFQYLGPIRSLPPRHLAFTENEDTDWYAGGAYAWDVVKRDAKVRQAVNSWLGSEKLKTRYELKVRPYRALDVEELSKSLTSAFEELETWKEGRESDTGYMDGEVSALRSEIEDIEQKLSTNYKLVEQLKAVIDAGGDEQKKLEIPNVLSQLQLQIKKLEAQRDLQQTELDKKESEYFDRAGEDLNEARTEELLHELGLSESEVYPDLILIDQRTNTAVTHRDVGIGISQVLPVLVMAYGSHSKILAMEQPEIHLHPALQAELGDVFIESALGDQKNTFILETHSEHLILRLLRRIRETSEGRLPTGITPIRPQDVGVLYVLPGKDGSVITEIPIRPDGEFITDWPDGFFPERGEEIF